MMNALARFCRIRGDDRGSMAIETAFVAPVLLILALGGFEVSTMVARQTELQSAAAEAAAVVRAAAPETSNERNTVRDILATSLCGSTDPTIVEGAATCGTVSVAVTPTYRCGTSTAYTNTADSCGSVTEYKFILLEIEDRYDPIWTEWGVGAGFDYYVSRTVQIG
ncbi:pilus assembly protein [Aurantiacibacter sp. MUD11]|uniref:TadE/TadG family type IV pilus assembly protein n=1 Tax=Aurantiacibacter sp. MUD11 TaxID=3003265 RepID=UPI0022AAEF70|nr:TadE/TadG family type IV pilus assembly protein [Aurantiacibacter sp. MUD11]WAT18418.1 pilus assembly protein [Aurantiacibacter sp. MUD11]